MSDLTDGYRIQLKKLADGWWAWRIVSADHRIQEEGNRQRRTRRAAIRAARKRFRYLQRRWAEKWEDA
jgi:hypothetical protein